jgi:nicotinamidase-related amidase
MSTHLLQFDFRAATFLAEGQAIMHVQHDGGPGHVLAKGSAGWRIIRRRFRGPAVSWSRKRHTSSFHDTDLHRRLADAAIDRLVIAGMQTEMCVDSAGRCAAALAYRIVLVADGHTTWDTPVIDAERIIAHHNRLLSHGFADVVAPAM